MLVNLNILPGLPKVGGGFGDFPKLPEASPLGTPMMETAMPAAVDPSEGDNAESHFAAILQEAIAAVSRQDERADQVALAAATGKEVDPHVMMIESAKAETLLHLTSSITTKAAQGYQTLMNMQI
ncbi:MAG: flagellar hook-basal body complex protein FliE [Cyanobacteria bacterium NC_groundwater_1444_Ag_S-0.65um_54_12]|nr:flagellar hook-basal body complex protein FliE [Cyanobacteria bacterium NC_groundwater_1444_Ag_S-0.65um_54_12]